MANDIMDNLKWEDNSKIMYDTLVDAVPFLLKAGVIKQAAKWIDSHNVKVVNEDTVFKVIDDIAPKSFAEKIVPKLEVLRTKSVKN